MPIQNLTNVPKSFLKLGQIRKGDKLQGKRQDGSTYERPVDLDYFRVTFLKGVTVGSEKVNLSEIIEHRFREVYGNKPTAINVRFADHDVNSVWDANFECYKQGGLVAKAGSTAERGLYWIFYRHPETMETLISDERARTPEGFVLQEKPIDLTQPIYKNKKGEPFFLEPVGRLKVVIPEIAEIAVGYFEFRPESPRDIRNISAELGAFDAVAKQYGKTIAGVPFVLRRREEDVTKRIEGKLVADKSWVVHLDVSGEWGVRALNVIERLALPEIIEGETTEIPQIESGDMVEPEAHPELPVVESDKGKTQGSERDWTPEQVHVLIENRLAGNEFAARGMLGLSNLPADATEAEILRWGKAYREMRPDPKIKGTPTSEEAASYANLQMLIKA